MIAEPGTPDVEPVVARAQADAQRHVAAWRDGYEGSLDVALSWVLSSRELGIGEAYRSQYTTALALEARRLHAKLVVRAAATAVYWAYSRSWAPLDSAHEPDRAFLASEWQRVAAEIGAQVDNDLLRLAFEQLTRVAVARELVHADLARQLARMSAKDPRATLEETRRIGGTETWDGE